MMKQTLTIAFFFISFLSFAQKEYHLVNGDWYIINHAISDVELLKVDTLILRRYSWEDRNGEYVDSSFHTKYLWNVTFNEFGGFSIGWVDYRAAAKGGESPYYHEMYPCENSIWKLKRNKITFYLGSMKYAFKIVKNTDELILLKDVWLNPIFNEYWTNLQGLI